MSSPLLVGNDIIPMHGGLPKTMRMFGHVLNANMISFTSPSFPDSERDAFSDIIHIPTSGKPLLKWFGWTQNRNLKPVESLLSETEIMSCHALLRYHAHWVYTTSKKFDIPYWVVPHGVLDPYVYTYRSEIKKIWLSLFGNKILSNAAHVIFSTEQERKKAAWFYHGENTQVAHWPVDLIDITEKADAAITLRSRLNLPVDAKVLLYFGRLHSMKRPLETLELFAKLTNPNLHLLLVGPDGDITQQDCIRKAAGLGIANRVHVPGPVYGSEKEQLLLGSDVFISLSHRENFGHTAAESLAAGTPVILSPGNDLSPELAPYRCGWFLQNGLEADAISAIQEFADTPNEVLQDMGKRGRQFIAKECSFDLFRDKLLTLKKEALENHSKK